MQTIPENLPGGNNREVLNFLHNRSCHGDNTGSLHNILSCYAGVRWFCPDTGNYSYIQWYRGNMALADGVGMPGVSLRTEAARVSLAAGLAHETKCFDGNDWYEPAYACRRLEQLARQAYEDAVTR